MMVDTIILCGGAGLRLRAITGNTPKSLASVSGRPFLETLLNQLLRFGFQRAILAVGYAADAIQSHIGQTFASVDIEYSHEATPLGTGGALANAAAHVKSKSCLVMNGDSYTDVDLHRFVAAHLESEADVSVAVIPVDERGDVGSVVVDGDGNVVKFAEKEPSLRSRYLNAGIYMLSQRMLFEIPSGRPISLERELFPLWIRECRRIRAFIHLGTCVDIGTPERYQTAQKTLANAEFASARARDEESRA